MKQLDHEADAFEVAMLAERPEIPADFAAQLDAWAAEGFPATEDAPSRASSWDDLRRRLSQIRVGTMLAPAAGLAVALVALVVGISSLGTFGGDDNGSEIGGGAVPISADDAPQPDAATEGDASVAAPAENSTEIAPDDPAIVPPDPVPAIGGSGGEKLNPGQQRIQENTVTTTLSAQPDELDDVADGVVEVTERYDGIVVSSYVNTCDDRGRASFALRVPAQNLQAFLADLSDLANVTARSEGTLDITAPFVSAEERFDESKAEVDSLIAELAEADSSDERAAVKAELSIARGTLAAVRTELAQLKQRADFATVSVTITGDGDTGGSSIGDAADDAVSVLEDIAGATLIALAVILPVGALLAAIAWTTSRLRRRRRESALDD